MRYQNPILRRAFYKLSNLGSIGYINKI